MGRWSPRASSADPGPPSRPYPWDGMWSALCPCRRARARSSPGRCSWESSSSSWESAPGPSLSLLLPSSPLAGLRRQPSLLPRPLHLLRPQSLALSRHRPPGPLCPRAPRVPRRPQFGRPPLALRRYLLPRLRLPRLGPSPLPRRPPLPRRCRSGHRPSLRRARRSRQPQPLRQPPWALRCRLARPRDRPMPNPPPPPATQRPSAHGAPQLPQRGHVASLRWHRPRSLALHGRPQARPRGEPRLHKRRG